MTGPGPGTPGPGRGQGISGCRIDQIGCGRLGGPYQVDGASDALHLRVGHFSCPVLSEGDRPNDGLQSIRLGDGVGSLSPFLIVPLGARLFKEHMNPRALVFALPAFGGLAIVLFSAPPNGDASLHGNVFGVTAMLLWTGYVTTTRYFRRDMDVAVFMATISPIAAVAVLPLAITNGDVFGMSSTGWTYMLTLTFLTGVAAHGLMVYAEKTYRLARSGRYPGDQVAARVRLVVLAARRATQRAANRRHHASFSLGLACLPGHEPTRQPHVAVPIVDPTS